MIIPVLLHNLANFEKFVNLFKKLELAHFDTRIERHWGKRAELKDHMLNLLKKEFIRSFGLKV
jgi:hypothetical protein